MCLSTSSFEAFIPSFQPRQQHSLLGSAVSPILEGSSVCCQTKAGGLSLSQKGSWFTLVHFLRMYHSLSHRTYPRVRYMERSTTYGCHFIDQLLSSRKVVDPADVICWRKRFSPQTLGCFKFSSFTELVQRLMTCWLLFRLFVTFEGRVGLFLCGRTPCAITTPDMSIWNVSRVLTLYQTSPFLGCITAFCFFNFLGVRVRQ